MRQDLTCDLVHELGHQLVLPLEDGADVGMVRAGPHHLAFAQFRQFGRQTHSLTAHIKPTTQDKACAQQFAQPINAEVGVAYRCRCQPRQHPKPRVTRQRGNDFVGHGVAQGIVCGVCRH